MALSNCPRRDHPLTSMDKINDRCGGCGEPLGFTSAITDSPTRTHSPGAPSFEGTSGRTGYSTRESLKWGTVGPA